MTIMPDLLNNQTNSIAWLGHIKFHSEFVFRARPKWNIKLRTLYVHNANLEASKILRGPLEPN